MNIRNEWRIFSRNQKVWISLVAVVALLAAAIGCFRLAGPQNWYVVSLKTGTCVSASQVTEELGHPHRVSPYKLGRWDQKHLEGYRGTQTYQLSRGRGVGVMMVNSANFMVYFSKKSTCLAYLKYRGDN